MERWKLFWVVVAWAHSGQGCILSINGSDHPWLIRITKSGNTVAHGSLVSTGKVLTAAGIRTVVTDKDVRTKDLALIGYNDKDHCNQTRTADEIIYHWLSSKYDYCNLGEFALILPEDEFVTIGGPLIVSYPFNAPYPMPGEARIVEENIELLNEGNGSVSTYMFSDKKALGKGDLADPKGTFPFLAWTKCVETPSFKAIKGTRDPSATNFTFFCGKTIPGKTDAKESPKGVSYDWYMGAPVLYHHTEGNVSGIGIYLFPSGKGGPYVFATFTQYLFDFIDGNIPNGPGPNTTFTWPTSWTTYPGDEFKISDDVRTTFGHKSQASRFCQHPKARIMTVGLSGLVFSYYT